MSLINRQLQLLYNKLGQAEKHRYAVINMDNPQHVTAQAVSRDYAVAFCRVMLVILWCNTALCAIFGQRKRKMEDAKTDINH